MKYITSVGSHQFEIEIEELGQIRIDGEVHQVDVQKVAAGRLYSLLLDHNSYESYVENDQGNQYQVLLCGELYHVRVDDERAIRLARGTAGFVPDSGEIPVQAPMPGLIVSVPVTAGQQVQQGQVLVILESMKMDNELCAPRDGVVARVHVAQGESVDGRQTLVTLT